MATVQRLVISVIHTTNRYRREEVFSGWWGKVGGNAGGSGRGWDNKTLQWNVVLVNIHAPFAFVQAVQVSFISLNFHSSNSPIVVMKIILILIIIITTVQISIL